MRIGIALGLYYGDHVGGAEVQTSYLVDHFLSKDHEVSIIHFGSENKKAAIEKRGVFSRYQVRIPWRNIKSTSYLNRRAIFKTIDEMRPDILYQRGDFHFSDLISSYGNSRGIPVVSSVTMERHCYPEPLYFDRMLPVRIIDRYLKKRYFKWSDRIITQTLHQKEVLKKNLGYDSTVIGNGHPVPKPPFIKDDPPLISWIANIKPIKRPFEFIKLCEKLKDLDVKFIMVGRPYLASYQKDLDERISSIDNLQYMGEVRPEAANDIISRSSIMVNTSESEGFSNTFIQAWMRETPVVTFSADPDDAIARNGLGSVTGTYEGAIESIRGYLEDEKMRIETGKRAREYAIKEHDISIIGNLYLSVFKELIETYPRRR